MCQWARVLGAQGPAAAVRVKTVSSGTRHLFHHLRNKAFDANFRIETALHEVGARNRHVAAVIPVLRLNVEVRGSVHARAIRHEALRTTAVPRAPPDRLLGGVLEIASSRPGSFLAFLAEAYLPASLYSIALLVLHVAHLVEHEAGFADFAAEVHQRVLVEVLYMASSDTGGTLREVALLRAFEAERVRDTLLFIAVKACTVLLVALVLEAARLEAKDFWQHHADELGQYAHFLVL